MIPWVRQYAPLSCTTSSRSPRIRPPASKAAAIRWACCREWFTATRCSAAVLHPHHRPAQRPGQPRDQEVLRVELAAGAEPAARVHRVHVDQRLVQAEHRGQQVPVEHRHLGHPEDRQPAGGRVGVGEQRARLQRDRAVPPDLHLDLHDPVGPGERPGHVPVAQAEVGGHVAAREQRRGARCRRPPRRPAPRAPRRCRCPPARRRPRPRTGPARPPRPPARPRTAPCPRPAPAAGTRGGRRPATWSRTGMASPGGRLAAVTTVTTPSAWSGLGSVHAARSRPCATGERTTRAHSWPGRAKSAPNRPRPRSRRGSSLRAMLAPMPPRGMLGPMVTAPPGRAAAGPSPARPRRCPGNRCTGTG